MSEFNMKPAKHIKLTDIYGKQVEVGNGKKIWLSLFREANCPFCNYRVYELTHNYKEISALDIEIVAVFKSNQEMVEKFIAKQPRPFRLIADAEGKLMDEFGSKSSFLGKLKAMMLRMPRLILGMKSTGMAGMKTGNNLPVDVLINEKGWIVSSYFGKDIGDHIPMQQVIEFAERM